MVHIQDYWGNISQLRLTPMESVKLLETPVVFNALPGKTFNLGMSLAAVNSSYLHQARSQLQPRHLSRQRWCCVSEPTAFNHHEMQGHWVIGVGRECRGVAGLGVYDNPLLSPLVVN